MDKGLVILTNENQGLNMAGPSNSMEGEHISGKENDVLDMSLLCRICGATSDYLIPIFEGEGLDNDLCKKISDYLPIKVLRRELLPEQTCYQCASTLLAWHDLVQCCIQADLTLREKLKLGHPRQAKKRKLPDVTLEETVQKVSENTAQAAAKRSQPNSRNILKPRVGNKMESEPEGDREKGRGAAPQPGACIVIKRGPEDKDKETQTAVASQDESVDLLSSDDEQQNVAAPEQVMRSSVSEVNNTPKDPIANSGRVPTGVQKCRGCFEALPDQIKMMYHIARCEKVLKGDVSTSSSQKLCALSKVVVYPCSTCPKIFITEETLQKHQQTQHARCQYCQQIFKTSTELASHTKEMHKHTCKKCGDVYHAKEPAKRHCGIPQGELEAEAAKPDKNVEEKEEIVKPTLQDTTSGLLVASEAPSDNANKTTSTKVVSSNVSQLLESGTFDPFACTQRMDVLVKACRVMKKCVFCSIPYENPKNCRKHVLNCCKLAAYMKKRYQVPLKTCTLSPSAPDKQEPAPEMLAAPQSQAVASHQLAPKCLPQSTKSNNPEMDKALNFNFVDIPSIPLEPKCECLICGASTASSESLLTHMELHHKNVDPLADVIKEEDCSTQPGDQEEENQSLVQSEKHAEIKSKEQKDVVKPTEKDICLQSSSITSEISKSADMKVRIPSNPVIGTRSRNFRCLLCFSKCADWKDLFKHCWKSHKVKLKRICVPSSKENDIQQKGRNNPVSGREMKCFLCNLNCLSWDALNSHYLNAHDIRIVAREGLWSRRRISTLLMKSKNAPRVNVGPILDDFFNQTIQVLTVNSIPTKGSITCKLCLKTCRNYTLYKKHLLHMHSARALFMKPKSYVCAYCKKPFGSVDEMKNHLTAKHSNYITCKYCTVPMSGTVQQRTAHMKKVHPTILDCSLCDLLFQTKQEQAQHLTWHSRGEEHKCELCSNTIIGHRKYKWHMQRHNVENASLCPICGQTFRTSHALMLHNYRMHQGPRDTLCVECGVTVPKAMYGWHRRHMHGAKVLGMCDMCPQVYRKRSNLARHQQECHSGDLHPCESCNVTFPTGADLAQHRQEVFHPPPTPTKLYPCQDCGQQKNSARNLRVHRRFQHEKHLFESCTVCSMKFPFARTLEKHMLIHLGDKAEHVCTSCKKPFVSAVSLRHHLQKVHQVERPFTCSLCPYKFYRQESLIIHERIHTNEKPYVCKVCPKTFRDIDACKQHEARMHKMHSPLPGTAYKYICEECGKGLTSASRLLVHQRTQHEKHLFVSCPMCSIKFPYVKMLEHHMLKHQVAKHMCSVCKMPFVSEVTWGAHMQTEHQVERPFSCQYCPAKFKLKNGVFLHERTHTGEKPHVCKVCSKAFRQRYSCKRHEMRMHKMHSAALGSASSPEHMLIAESLARLDQSRQKQKFGYIVG